MRRTAPIRSETWASQNSRSEGLPRSSADPAVAEPRADGEFRIDDAPTVEDDGPRDPRTDRDQVNLRKLRPFSGHHNGFCAVEDLFRRISKADPWSSMLSSLPAHVRIESGNYVVSVQETPGDVQCRRATQVIGVSLETQAEQANARTCRGQLSDDPPDKPVLLLHIDLRHGSGDVHRNAMSPTGDRQNLEFLRKTRATETQAWTHVCRTDARVKRDAVEDLIHVDAQFLGEIGNLVDEAQFECEESVRDVLYNLAATTSTSSRGASMGAKTCSRRDMWSADVSGYRPMTIRDGRAKSSIAEP